VKFKLDENLPVSSAAILTSVGHDVDAVTQEGLIGASDRDVVAAATAAGRILISLDRGLGDIRAYPPGSHAGIVVLRLTDQSAAAAIKAVSDLATLTNPDSLAGAVAVLQRGLLRIRHPLAPASHWEPVEVSRSDVPALKDQRRPGEPNVRRSATALSRARRRSR
jgi:predicted nuclease of predicted toxin-antitoxin system